MRSSHAEFSSFTSSKEAFLSEKLLDIYKFFQEVERDLSAGLEKEYWSGVTSVDSYHELPRVILSRTREKLHIIENPLMWYSEAKSAGVKDDQELKNIKDAKVPADMTEFIDKVMIKNLTEYAVKRLNALTAKERLLDLIGYKLISIAGASLDRKKIVDSLRTLKSDIDRKIATQNGNIEDLSTRGIVEDLSGVTTFGKPRLSNHLVDKSTGELTEKGTTLELDCLKILRVFLTSLNKTIESSVL